MNPGLPSESSRSKEGGQGCKGEALVVGACSGHPADQPERVRRVSSEEHIRKMRVHPGWGEKGEKAARQRCRQKALRQVRAVSILREGHEVWAGREVLKQNETFRMREGLKGMDGTPLALSPLLTSPASS